MVRAILGDMGPRRPRSLVLGAVALTAALWTHTAAASQPGRPAVVRGAVDATGLPITASVDWRVEHVTVGVYRVRLPEGRVSVDVRRWDAVADVTVRPLGRGVNEVQFDLDGRPVDSGFAFVALTAR